MWGVEYGAWVQKPHNPDFSRVRAVSEQGISARRRCYLLQGLNNSAKAGLWLALGKKHQIIFFKFGTNVFFAVKKAYFLYQLPLAS